ncbi:MAG: exodeoxyribonuclease VII small subunit [Armatimonadetes bacterium]|nr:exodeoxyribonuclease VII small subunit [Armatimonadota bacterium]
MNKTPTPEEMTFEQAIERLEEIVAELDRGDLALEEALKLFQEGTALRATCERKLAEAEATVEELLQPAASEDEAEAETSEPPAAGNLFGEDDE